MEVVTFFTTNSLKKQTVTSHDLMPATHRSTMHTHALYTTSFYKFLNLKQSYNYYAI
jgi:hypothetical protein